eukprot:g2277.t1
MNPPNSGTSSLSTIIPSLDIEHKINRQPKLIRLGMADPSPRRPGEKRALGASSDQLSLSIGSNGTLARNQKAFLSSLSQKSLPSTNSAEKRIAVTIPAEKRPVIKRRKNPTVIRKKENRKNTYDDGGGRWTKAEDRRLKEAVDKAGPKNWKLISQDYMGGKRSDVQCLHRWQKVLRPGLVKGPWTKDEDDTIIRCVNEGITKWSEIAESIPGRIGKQCRERWFNHLDPKIKKGAWSKEEDTILLTEQKKLGNRWCKIASFLEGRSENAVKNRWNSAMRRKYPGGATEPDGTRVLTMEDMRNTKSGGEIYGEPPAISSKGKGKSKSKKTRKTSKGKERKKEKTASKSNKFSGKANVEPSKRRKRSFDTSSSSKTSSVKQTRQTKSTNGKASKGVRKTQKGGSLWKPPLKHSFSAPAIKTIKLPEGLQRGSLKKKRLRRHNSLSSLGPEAPHNKIHRHSDPYSAHVQLFDQQQPYHVEHDPLQLVKPNQRHIDILSNLLDNHGEKSTERQKFKKSPKAILDLSEREKKLMMHAFLQGVSDEREESIMLESTRQGSNISSDFAESKITVHSPLDNITQWSLDKDDQTVMADIVNSQDAIGSIAEKLAAQMKEHLNSRWQGQHSGHDPKTLHLSNPESLHILEDSKPRYVFLSRMTTSFTLQKLFTHIDSFFSFKV